MRVKRDAVRIVCMTTTDMPTGAAPRRLTRPRDTRIVAGVCAAAGRYWDIDPVIPRVVLAVLTVFGGAGLVIYALGWLLIPEDGAPSTRFERWLEGHQGDRSRDLLIVVLALLAVGFVVNSNPFAHRISGAALLVVLVIAASALVGRRRNARLSPPLDDRPPGAAFGPTAAPYGPSGQPQTSQPTAVWTAPVAPPRPRSWLGWLTIGLALLVAGGFSIVAAAGWAHPQPADVLAACVGVLGVGLLVGTVYGRAWSLIPVGALLVGALAVANALPRNLTWTAGNRTWTPLAASSAPYVLEVPAGTTVIVHAKASAGRIDVFGEEQDGTGVDVRRTVASAAKHPTTVTLDLDMGFGDIELRGPDVFHAAA
jgi:phage shock protein PspC (stress-responsive transcriptional regulator)